MADADMNQPAPMPAGSGRSPEVELTAADLTGPGVVFCPNPKMALWSNHPRVFLDVHTTGVSRCPYCGTVYRLKAGEKAGSRH